MLAKSLQAAAGNAAEANYIEDVFSTWLYTGNGSTQTITNGIDLAGKGGLTWIKDRTTGGAGSSHFLFDTIRGVLNEMNANNTGAQASLANSLTAFNSNGFSLGNATGINNSSIPFASWTFRKQPKFFDVITFTGTGTSSRTVAHNLESTPGFMVVRKINSTDNWYVYHRSTGATQTAVLDQGGGFFALSTAWNNTAPTSTVFTVGSSLNTNGAAYIAYVFAHNAGGFGLDGTANVISCGSFTTDIDGNATVSVGFEPQFVLTKRSSSTQDWNFWDSMRGMTAPPSDAASQSVGVSLTLSPESSYNGGVKAYASGFVTAPASTALTGEGTYIYVAIRRGPMKVPTSGTSVFAPTAATSGVQTVNFPIDLQLLRERASSVELKVVDRLRGASSTTTETNNLTLYTTSDTAATAASGWTRNWTNTAFTVPSGLGAAASVFWSFRRAPGFFDSVYYTGTGSNISRNHGLGVAPELWIVKRRNTTGAWQVGSTAIANTEYLVLNTTAAKATGTTRWNSTYPTASVFTTGTDATVNANASTYLAYLFATCPGVSKVGSYTGTGTTLQIDCGFAGGARFVLIKRTNSTGGWYVWDSARGIVSGNDPYLLLNGVAAEVTNTDYIDTFSSGFEISSTAPAAINASGGTFLFLAIA
jgi:hypothetical protein